MFRKLGYLCGGAIHLNKDDWRRRKICDSCKLCRDDAPSLMKHLKYAKYLWDNAK